MMLDYVKCFVYIKLHDCMISVVIDVLDYIYKYWTSLVYMELILVVIVYNSVYFWISFPSILWKNFAFKFMRDIGL